MANKKRGTIYIGVTSDVIKRVDQHKNKITDGFTKHYSIDRLVYYECADTIDVAVAREKQLKNWHRHWKINLIERENPEWLDLNSQILNGNIDPETSSG